MRNFVLYPLLEICSDFKDPRNGKSIQTLLVNSKDSVIPKKVEERNIYTRNKKNNCSGRINRGRKNRIFKKITRCIIWRISI